MATSMTSPLNASRSLPTPRPPRLRVNQLSGSLVSLASNFFRLARALDAGLASGSAALFGGYPGVDLFFQDFHRQGAGHEDLGVEFADVEFRAQSLLGAGAEAADG